MAQTTNTKTMTRAERFMSVWIENNGYQYDNFPVGECMQSYADHQLKAKMPSNSKIQTGIDLANEIYFDGSRTTQRILMFGAKWLKQQIIKS